MTVLETAQRERAASLDELRAKGRLVVGLNGHTVCLLAEGDEVYAVDNRCPHMGFPLHRGTTRASTSARAAPSTSSPTSCAASPSRSTVTTSTST